MRTPPPYTEPATPQTGPPSGPQDIYCSSAATGGGAGTAADPYTLAEARAAVTEGHILHLAGDFGSDSFFNFGGDTIRGTATNWVKIQQWAGQSQAHLRAGASTFAPLYMRGNTGYAEYIRVEGLSLHGNTSDGAVYIADGANHIHIVGCTIESPRAGFSTGVTCGDAGRVNGVSAIWIDGNTISNISEIPTGTESPKTTTSNEGDGVWVCSGTTTLTDDVTVVRNTITSCGHGAISVNINGTAGRPTNVSIALNDCANTWAGGIIPTGMDGGVIEWNTIRLSATGALSADGSPWAHSMEGIILSGCTNVVCRYNRIYGNWGAAIKLQANVFGGLGTQVCNGCHVHGNTAYNNGGSFIMVAANSSNDATTDLINNTVENNLMWANHLGGLTQYDPYQNNRGAYFNGNYQRIWIDTLAAATEWPAGTFGGNVFRNNWFARDASSVDNFCIVVKTGGNEYYTLAQFESAATGSADNVTSGDPLLTNPASADFTLQSGSGCIDTGYPVSGESFLGGGHDIGWDEAAASGGGGGGSLATAEEIAVIRRRRTRGRLF